jgi:hypothetical protein
MSLKDTNSTPSIASDNTTAVGQSSTMSHIDSTQLSKRQKTTLVMFSKHGFRLLPINSMINGQCTCSRGSECPEKSRGKHPRIMAWQENATTGLVQLTKWMKQWPNTNWAMACGPESKVWVLDIDNHKNGYESLKRLEEEVGKLPETVRVKTGGGGLHIYFAWPADGSLITNKVDLTEYEGIDVRGEGGYVVVPPALHRSGNRYEWIEGYDPDSIELAQAPQTLIELIKTSAEFARPKDKPRDTRPWEPVPNEVIREKVALCPRLAYFISKEGANDATYDDWIAMASWAHALTDDEEIFQEWSSAYAGHNERDTHEKWKNTANMAPRSCRRAQADHPLEACKECPFAGTIKNPALLIRESYARDLGMKGPFGAPPPTPEELEQRLKVAEERRQERDWYMDSLASGNKQDKTDESEVETDGATAVAPVIDVTEDDEEGSTATDNTEGQAAFQQPNFRLATDNITPLIEQSKALEVRLRNGEDPHDLMPEVARVLAAIKKLDVIRYDIEKDRLVSAEGDARKKGQKARYTSKKIDDAVKAIFEREAAELLKKISTVGEFWPAAPDSDLEIPVPPGYLGDEEGVKRIISASQGSFGTETVSSQPTYIAGIREDFATGEVKSVIRTLTRQYGWLTVVEKPSSFDDKRSTSFLKERYCSFIDPNSFGRYCNEGHNLITSVFGFPPEMSTARLGMHVKGDWVGFVFPEISFAPFPLHFDGSAALAREFSVAGKKEEECDVLVDTMFKYPQLAFAIGFAAASWLFRPLKLKGSIKMSGLATEYVTTATNTGKSSTVEAAFAPFGSPAEALRMFEGTQLGISEKLLARSDLPVPYQETQEAKKAQGNYADPGMLLHSIADGGGKERAKRGGGNNINPQRYNVMLFASNDHLLPMDNSQGQDMRIFSFEPPFPPNDAVAKKNIERLSDRIAENHGHGARAMIGKVLQEVNYSFKGLQERLSADHKEQRERVSALITLQEGTSGWSDFDRRAKYVALARLGLKYLIEYGYGLPAQVTDRVHKGIDEVFTKLMENHVANVDEHIEWKKHFRDVDSWVIQNQTRIWPLETTRTVITPGVDGGDLVLPDIPKNGYIGAVKLIDGEYYLGIISKNLDEFFKDKKRNTTPIVREWYKQKVMIRDETGKKYVRRAWFGYEEHKVKEYFYFIKLEETGLTLSKRQKRIVDEFGEK